MKVRIVVIGDEILLGRVTDTNSGAIARMLDPVGWSVDGVEVCGDSAESISQSIRRAMDKADVVLTTGGLGPTRDDITKQVLMDIFGGELRHDSDVMANVERMMSRRGLTVNALTATQAMVPTSCEVIRNPAGTAPVMLFRKGAKTLVAMPGVTSETLAVFPDGVLPRLLSLYPSAAGKIAHRTIIVEGIPESQIAMNLADWEDSLPKELHLAYLPNNGIVRLRIDATGVDAEVKAAQAHAQLTDLMKDYLLADTDITAPALFLELLKQKGMTVATAESCTGGNIAHELTLIPGSSEAFTGSVVAYSNSVKANLLGVNAADIERHGAVSAQVVEQMAEGVARACGAQVGIATSGIAGPGGGSEEKPVGTVYIGVHTPAGTVSYREIFPGGRATVIARATQRALVRTIRLIR